ncbi:Hypothetical protein NocV09_02001280 [Nannochloropsis oceanica]
MFSSPHAVHFEATTHIPPIVCFLVIPLYHIYLFAFRSRGKASLPFFGNIRVHWAMEMFNTGNIAAINSMRDFSKITMFLAANSTLAASILVTFAYQVFSRCPNMSLSGCSSETLYLTAQLVVLIVNFFFIIIHMLMATRFALNVEFMLNTKEIGGRLLRPEAVAAVLSRANLYYGVGLRQTYYSIPLFAWLLGPWSLVGVTVIYLAFVYYIESVDKFLHTVNHVIGESDGPTAYNSSTTTDDRNGNGNNNSSSNSGSNSNGIGSNAGLAGGRDGGRACEVRVVERPADV